MMDKDIVPELLKQIDEKFKSDNAESKLLKAVVEKLKSGTATYEDVNKLSIEIGTNLSKAINEFVTAESLPDGKMYFNISDRLMNHTLKNNYDIVSGYAEDVQKQLNKKANLHLKAQVPDFNQEKVKGIVERLANAENFDDISWILNEPLITFTQSIVDDSIQKNVEFQAKAGLQPRITRTVIGKPCKWCRNLAGSYLYSEAPKDVYRRHERCRCIVDYHPGDGRRQNVWSKAWKDPKKDDKIRARKLISLHQDGPIFNENDKDKPVITSVEWFREINGMTPKGSKYLNIVNSEINKYSQQTGNEMLAIVNKVNGNILIKQTGTNNRIDFDKRTVEYLKTSEDNSLILSHSHPGELKSNFSKADIMKLFKYPSIESLTLQTIQDGSQYLLDRNGKKFNFIETYRFNGNYDKNLDGFINKYGEDDKLWNIITRETVESISKKYGLNFRRFKNGQ